MIRRRHVDIDDGWDQLRTALTSVVDFVASGFDEKKGFDIDTHMKCYNLVHVLCTQRDPKRRNKVAAFSEELYTRVVRFVRDTMDHSVAPSVRNKYDNMLLKELVDKWAQHKLLDRFVRFTFDYLDRYYPARVGKPTVRDVLMEAFTTRVLFAVRDRVMARVLELLHDDREGEQIDASLLHGAKDVYCEVLLQSPLDVYTMSWEEPLLEATSRYYAQKSGGWIQQYSCPEYMQKAEQCLKLEEERVATYMHPITRAKLMDCVEHELLEVHEAELLRKEASGVRVLLRDNKRDDLSRMYRLFSRSGVAKGLTPVGQALKADIKAAGLVLMEEQADAKDFTTFVPKLLALHHRYYDLVQHCFQGNPVFSKHMKEAMEFFLNKSVTNKRLKRKTTAAELLSVYTDSLLRKGSPSKLSEEQLDARLDDIVLLFSYLTDRDMFGEFYRKQLSRRLLLQRSASDEMERTMIAKLKLRCGAQFTSKMEGMVTDMSLAEEVQREFADYMSHAEQRPRYDMIVQVLTYGYWPSCRDSLLVLPAPLQEGVALFQQFYDTRTSHRKLRWLHQLGTMQIKGYPNAKNKRGHEFVLSTAQAIILLQFNTHDHRTIGDIVDTLGLSRDECTRLLLSLCCGKYRVLRKQHKNTRFADDERIIVNHTFKDAKYRIQIPLIAMKLTNEDVKQTQRTVSSDRKHAIEAAVVRVMKSRKTLQHRDLVLEVSKQLMAHFSPDPRVIKKRIEDLIAREYLERDASSSNTYHYLA